MKAIEWKSTIGKIYKIRRGSPVNPFSCEEVNGLLQYRLGSGTLQQFTTQGRYSLRQTYSPDGKILALLTADGPERPSSPGHGMVFGKLGGGYYGQHYIEFFHLPDVTPVGKPVRIPFTTVEGLGTYCWSADGKYLVYPNSSGKKMCVIHVEQDEKKP